MYVDIWQTVMVILLKHLMIHIHFTWDLGHFLSGKTRSLDWQIDSIGPRGSCHFSIPGNEHFTGEKADDSTDSFWGDIFSQSHMKQWNNWTYQKSYLRLRLLNMVDLRYLSKKHSIFGWRTYGSARILPSIATNSSNCIYSLAVCHAAIETGPFRLLIYGT